MTDAAESGYMKLGFGVGADDGKNQSAIGWAASGRTDWDKAHNHIDPASRGEFLAGQTESRAISVAYGA